MLNLTVHYFNESLTKPHCGNTIVRVEEQCDCGSFSSVITRNAVNRTVSFREMLFVIQDYAVQTVCTLNLEHSAEQSRLYVIYWSTVLEQPINVQQIFICRMEHPVLKKATAIMGTALTTLCLAEKPEVLVPRAVNPTTFIDTVIFTLYFHLAMEFQRTRCISYYQKNSIINAKF